MSFGGTTPIYLLLFHVPVYNLFRVPARHLFEVGLALSVIAAIGLDILLVHPGRLPPTYPGETSERFSSRYFQLVRRALVRISVLMGIAVLVAFTLRSLAEGWFSRLFTIPDSTPLNYLYTFGAAKPAIIRNLSWNSPTLVMPLLILHFDRWNSLAFDPIAGCERRL